jgi:hypothetical protein
MTSQDRCGGRPAANRFTQLYDHPPGGASGHPVALTSIRLKTLGAAS